MWTFCISILRCLYFFSVFFLFEFYFFFFFFQAEDGIRDGHVTGVQTCALPICCARSSIERGNGLIPFGDMTQVFGAGSPEWNEAVASFNAAPGTAAKAKAQTDFVGIAIQIGRASCRERV